MIRIRKVSMQYALGGASVRVLDGIDLDVAPGERIAITGPSGSGKTTLLLLLAGLERPSSGSLELDGRRLEALGADALADLRRDRIGIVFQSFHLVPSLNALENVALPLEISGRSGARARARELLGEVGLAERLEARLDAIYAQQRFQSRFWFEAIFSDGALDPFITRHVGAAYLDPGEAIAAQNRIAAQAPSVVTVRTEAILAEARRLLRRAAAGLAVVAAVSLLASLLVLASVVAASRARQVYDASVLHALGARLEVIRHALRLEYALLAALTCAFAVACGGLITVALLEYRIRLDAGAAWWLGVAVAASVSTASLALGASYLLRRLRVSPALLLRSSG